MHILQLPSILSQWIFCNEFISSGVWVCASWQVPWVHLFSVVGESRSHMFLTGMLYHGGITMEQSDTGTYLFVCFLEENHFILINSTKNKIITASLRVPHKHLPSHLNEIPHSKNTLFHCSPEAGKLWERRGLPDDYTLYLHYQLYLYTK